jgi:serine/threonine protein kinase
MVSYPSDLYALAVTCISLLTGKVITTDSSSPDDLRSYDIPNNVVKWQQKAQVSLKLNSILNKMLNPEMENRINLLEKYLRKLVRRW